MNKGILITFEGPEGCGKSTQAERLYKYLVGKGWDVIYTYEPGGTVIGEAIRAILLDSGNKELTGLAELFLYCAARAQLVEEVIKPGLKAGKIVICDRFADSTVAYQGYGLGLDLDFIELLNRAALGGVLPDLTILLDLEVTVGLSRKLGEMVNRIEGRDLCFHERVRAGYLALAELEPDRIKVIDGSGDIVNISEEVIKLVAPIIGLEGD